MNLYPVSHLYEFMPEVEVTSRRPNPLGIVGALNDAEFIDMRISPQRSRAGILCDIKWCADFEGANTALVVLLGIGSIFWSNDEKSRQLPWHARYVTWEPQTATGNGLPSTPLAVESAHDQWALDVPNIPQAAATVAPTSAPAATEDGEREEYKLQLGRLSVSALGAALYIGHVDGLDGAPPDMTELGDAEIIVGYPQWSSIIKVREFYAYGRQTARS